MILNLNFDIENTNTYKRVTFYFFISKFGCFQGFCLLKIRKYVEKGSVSWYTLFDTWYFLPGLMPG